MQPRGPYRKKKANQLADVRGHTEADAEGSESMKEERSWRVKAIPKTIPWRAFQDSLRQPKRRCRESTYFDKTEAGAGEGNTLAPLLTA
jgi:hypothetical protein